MKIILLCLVLLTSVSYSKKIKLSDLQKNFSEKDHIRFIQKFVRASKPNRFFGTSGHKAATSFLEKQIQETIKGSLAEFKSYPFKINKTVAKKFYQDDFDKKIVGSFEPESEEYKKWWTFTRYMKSLVDRKSNIYGKNFEVTIKGKTDDTIVFLAHYDTVSHDKNFTVHENIKMPGADYNATGVSLLLSLLKFSLQIKPSKTLKFVWTDGAALASSGAWHYLQKANKKKIIGLVNLVMLGHDSKLFDKEKKLKNMRVYMRKTTNDDLVFFKSYFGIIKDYSLKKLFTPIQNDQDSSEHYWAWKNGIPALSFSQNWEDDFNEKRYQTQNDIPETLNRKTLHMCFKYLSSMLFSLKVD